MVCYACQGRAEARCSRCSREFCAQHGAGICALCSSPASAFPSGALYRSTIGASAALLVLAAAYILWWPEFAPGQPRTVLAGPRTGARPATGTPAPERAQSQGGGTAAPAPAASPSPPAAPIPEPPRKYTVVGGDTLLGIAIRAGTTVEELMRLNGLSDAARLSLGQELIVAAPSPSPPAASAGVAAPPSPLPPRKHTVTSGDTLVDIAKRYGTTVEDIVQINGLSDAARLSLGQELALSSAATASSPPGSAPAPQQASPTPRPAPRTYAVVGGDTLLGIAIRAGTTVEELMRLNGLSDAARLSLGQELTLP